MLVLRHIASVYALDEVCTEKGHRVYILKEKAKQHTCPRVEHLELTRHPKLKGLIIAYTDEDFIISIRQNDSSIISYSHGTINESYKPTFHPVIHSSELPINDSCKILIENFYAMYISNSIDYISRGHALSRDISSNWSNVNNKLINKITNSINQYLKLLKTETNPKKLYEIRCKLDILIIYDMKYLDLLDKSISIENEINDISRLVSEI